MRRPLRPFERDFIQNPDTYTFESFRERTLDSLPPAAALGIADEELLNYYETKYRHGPPFTLSMDVNGGNYEKLEAYVARASCAVAGERIGDPGALQQYASAFAEFRRNAVIALFPFPEVQKIQLLKKIAIASGFDPGNIDEIADVFFSGSSLFSLELFIRLRDAGRLKAFSERLFLSDEALSGIVEKPELLTPLWDHQSRALEAWLRSGGRGVVEMATATGKTLVGLAAAERLFGLYGKLRVLVLAHSRPLLDQWRREAIRKLGFVGDEYGPYSSPLTFRDAFTITFATLQKVHKNPHAHAADLLIVDEVHHGAGRQFRKALGVPCRWKMGLSATVEGGERERVLEQVLGRTAYRFTLKEARERGIIPAFRFTIHKTFLETGEDREFAEISAAIIRLHARINERHSRLILALSNNRMSRFERLSDFVGLMKHHRYTGADVPEEWLQLLGLLYTRRMIIHRSSPKIHRAIELVQDEAVHKKCVVFSMDITTCERIYAGVRGCVQAFRVHSGLLEGERAAMLEGFRQCRTGVLIAPRMLDEGIDVPDAEIGINVASARTKLQLVQRMGRILRNRPNKQPVFHHFVALPRHFIDAEDAFSLQDDLSWIHDLTLTMGISATCVESDAGIAALERRSEEVAREHCKGHAEDDYGTIRINALVDAVDPGIRSRLARLLSGCTAPVTDDVWFSLLKEAHPDDAAIGVPNLRWLLIIAGRDPAVLQRLIRGEEVRRPSESHAPLPTLPAVPAPPDEAARWAKVLRYGRSDREKDAAAARLVEMGSHALPALVGLCTGRDKGAALRAMRVLGAIGDPRAVEPIARILRSPERDLRIAAATELGNLGSKQANFPLMKAQRDRDASVRRAVSRAMQGINEKSRSL